MHGQFILLERFWCGVGPDKGVGYRMTTRGRSKTTTTWLVFGDEGVEEGLEGL